VPALVLTASELGSAHVERRLRFYGDKWGRVAEEISYSWSRWCFEPLDLK